MSAEREAQDARLLDLLYGELPPDAANAVQAELRDDPEANARFEGWNAVRVAMASLPEPEPDPQAHYDILRAARAAAEATPAKRPWWAALSALALNPAFAAVGLVVVAAGALVIYGGIAEQAPTSGAFDDVVAQTPAPKPGAVVGSKSIAAPETEPAELENAKVAPVVTAAIEGESGRTKADEEGGGIAEAKVAPLAKEEAPRPTKVRRSRKKAKAALRPPTTKTPPRAPKDVREPRFAGDAQAVAGKRDAPAKKGGLRGVGGSAAPDGAADEGRERLVPALLKQARDARQRGDHRAAVRAYGEYRQNFRSHDEFGRSLYEAAQSHEALGDLVRARQLYRLIGRAQDPRLWSQAQERLRAIEASLGRTPAPAKARPAAEERAPQSY